MKAGKEIREEADHVCISLSWCDFGQVNLILGLLIVLGSSALNAFGLNLTKLDHVSSWLFPLCPTFTPSRSFLFPLFRSVLYRFEFRLAVFSTSIIYGHP